MRAHERLEREFGDWVHDGRHYVACSSGTAALHLALEALRLPPGSTVLVPDFTMVACARAVVLAGLTPAFVDCGEDLNMDETALKEALRGRRELVNWEEYEAGAAMYVHVYGRRCPIEPTSHREDQFIIEDLAEAHGIKPHEATDAACWSFYHNKIIAGEEGGMVAFKNPAHADLARSLRNVGFGPAHDFIHVPRGHNYRLADCLAEKVLISLCRYYDNMHHRREAVMWYDRSLPHGEWRIGPRAAPWTYDLRVPGLKRSGQARIVAALNKEGIAARMGFYPLSLQEEFRGCKRFGNQKSYSASQEVFYLPLTPGEVTEGTARLAMDTIKRVLEEHRAPR
jgi:dTDP-4-amino-4,6-dideoxygalactose transaminase